MKKFLSLILLVSMLVVGQPPIQLEDGECQTACFVVDVYINENGETCVIWNCPCGGGIQPPSCGFPIEP